jgi:hypothetical protein
MREIEQRFYNFCCWYNGNVERGEHILDSAKRYDFVCKALSNMAELQGMMLQELQRLNRRTTEGFTAIQMPGTRRSMRGEVSRDG